MSCNPFEVTNRQVDRFGSALFGVGLIAYIILLVSKSAALSYFAVYLAVS